MKIPLNNPIWGRLYGPCGVQNVNKNLQKLHSASDHDVAEDLYWEKWHHQDDLYPVTCAALPWLWDMQPEDKDLNTSLLCFVSHAISCSIPSEYAMVPNREFTGLALN